MVSLILIFVSFKITVDKEGNILEALCECPRGQSKCHHMATVALFSSQKSSSTSKVSMEFRSDNGTDLVLGYVAGSGSWPLLY